jgi:preprotein translocase subunit YajC
MLISPAWAQGVGGGFGGIESLLPLVLIFVVFYFLLIRPQQKKAKAHRELLAALRRGDRIVTTGGLIGQITRVLGDNELQVEIADGVRVRVLRGMVADVMARTEPARESIAEDEPEKPKSRARKSGGAKGSKASSGGSKASSSGSKASSASAAKSPDAEDASD